MDKIKLEDMKGKYVIRTKPSVTGDRSYMSEPIKIDRIENGIIFYRDIYSNYSQLRILCADQNDGSWAQIHESTVKELKRNR